MHKIAEIRRDSRGSAVTDFVLISGLLALMLVGLLQLALALYVHTIMLDAASQGARLGALVGSDARLGMERAEEIMAQGLPETYQRQVSSKIAPWPEEIGSQLDFDPKTLRVLEVQISAPIPIIGFYGLGTMQASGRAFIEIGPEYE